MVQCYYTTYQILLLSSLVALFLIFPDIVWTPYEMRDMPADRRPFHILFSVLRYVYFTLLVYQLIKVNLEKWSTTSFLKRLLHSAMVVVIAYILYGIICYSLYRRIRHFGSLVLFRFFIVAILSALIGHIYLLYTLQRGKEKEIELLKVERMLRYAKTLEQITSSLNPKLFYRANKQFIITRESVVDVVVGADSRLQVNLNIAVPEIIFVSKNRAADFKEWLIRCM
ncbi:LytTR family transcriptional regulator DNA-binding domain-containing protein [Sphingobacterium chungjuense]|uniref:LytTR family transcriptional regulator DNA-binding domain-containing protein n=1 Tax=Sphingobacterium chungjuense TaxID=2675553 RepID=UPI00140A3435|nr:LytTR family transcriptional regulator DNA-binding domain-containing protein [Sphingobacterium chungjuense]